MVMKICTPQQGLCMHVHGDPLEPAPPSLHRGIIVYWKTCPLHTESMEYYIQ